MDNSKDLSPLAKGDIEIGKPLPFPVFDRGGVLLLAAGQIVSDKQLGELAGKGLYFNPRWASPSLNSTVALGTVIPDGLQAPVKRTGKSNSTSRDPFERGNQFKMNLKGSADSFSVQFIGTYGRDAFVVSHPIKDGKCTFVKEGQLWDFRAFHGVSAFKFSAMVEKVLLSPYPMLVLSWPNRQQLDTQPVRSARRVGCEVPVSFHVAGGEPVNGRFLNLSTGGAELHSSRGDGFLQVGQSIHIALQLLLADQRKYLLELDASVVSKHPPVESGDECAWGLAFAQVPDSSFVVLHAFVCERLLDLSRSDLYIPE